jgi:hypothetical protein
LARFGAASVPDQSSFPFGATIKSGFVAGGGAASAGRAAKASASVGSTVRVMMRSRNFMSMSFCDLRRFLDTG